MAFNLGFHCGPGGNANGIGEYMRDLDQAGRPFCVKSTDDYGVVGMACRYHGADHVRIFRLTTAGQNDGQEYDVPAYHLPAADAARIHWQRTLAKLPPEFDKAKVWLEVVNEVDKNRSDWLGHFGVEIAQLAMSQGYRVALFGFSGGEPEREHWRTPGMLAFLRLCAQNRDRVAVALHEYSFSVLSLTTGMPWLLGRYGFLLDACDENGIEWPTILITEFGWTKDRVPDVDEALAQLDAVEPTYRLHNAVKGLAMWYLGSGFEGIANLAQRLILPVRDRRLQWPEPEPEPEPEPAGPVHGVDVSHHQDHMDWAVCRSAGAEFALIRASNGINPDRRFLTHWDVSGAHGFIRGPYHFYREDKPLLGQIDFFHNLAAERHEIPPAIDVEIFSGYPIPSADRVFSAIRYTEQLFNRRPILYTNLQWLAAHVPEDHPLRGYCDLWIAAWTTAPQPTIPTGWDRWTIWQYGKRPGRQYGASSAEIDVNRFNGSRRDLVAYANQSENPLLQFLWRESVVEQAERGLQFHPGFGLNDAIEAAGLAPVHNETVRTWAGQNYTIQTGEDLRGIRPREVFVWQPGQEVWSFTEDEQNPEPPPPPPPPPQPTGLDMQAYFRPAGGRSKGQIYILKNTWSGGEERCQLQLEGEYSYVTKNAQWEKRRLGPEYIDLVMDTSPGGDLYYTVEGHWLPNRMRVGESFTRTETVRFYYKANCALYQGPVTYTNQIILTDHYPSWTSRDGIALQDVVKLDWWVNGQVIESYWFAAGLGLVAWRNAAGDESWIKELVPVGSQQDNQREIIGCV